ncbi:MAG TPA: hypothetical protein VGJ07_12560 [Rugosimonospora sp.]
MEIPGLGSVTRDDEFGWYRSAMLPVRALGGAVCQIVVDGFDADPAKDELQAVIGTFLALDESALRAAAPSIFQYYQDTVADLDADEHGYGEIPGPDDVWNHVHIGGQAIIKRNPYGDRRVYVSVECECDWEPEHGLQVVFREGRAVSKVGPYDGHLTNAAAYARDDLSDVVYVRSG